MSGNSKIEWCDATWQPVVGCSKVSEGCKNCWAEKMAYRLACMGVPFYDMVQDEGCWNGNVETNKFALDKPLHWKQPRRIFVCSMSDLFHPSVPFEFIDKVFDTMLSCRQHTFQLLTKRPERALEYYDGVISDSSIMGEPAMIDHIDAKHIHLGVTAENQKCADERIPILLQIPAAVRFVSCEPLLGEIDLSRYVFEECRKIQCKNCGSYKSTGVWGIYMCGECGCGEGEEVDPNCEIDWGIFGCESGPKRRPCKIEDVRNIVNQFKAAGIPPFVKQLSINGKVSHKMEEWPEDLRIREYLK